MFSAASYRLPHGASIGNHARISSLRLTAVFGIAILLASCAVEEPGALKQANAKGGRMNVRTTAYTGSEAGGTRNALGQYLSGRHVVSAAADWSRFPLGTRFKLVATNEEFVIDDYGGALVGTSTIDLFKPTRLAMRQWGVRRVDIDILQWGSVEQSLKVLAPRLKHSRVARMVAALKSKHPTELAKR